MRKASAQRVAEAPVRRPWDGSHGLAAVMHEVRNALCAVVGYGDLLSESKLSAEQGQWVATMTRAAERGLEITGRVLETSKGSEGNGKVYPTSFGLAELLLDLVQEFAEPARAKGLELTMRIDPGVPAEMISDGLRLREILVNLVSNAIKFTEHGQIAISVAPVSNGRETVLRFTVADTGPGISPARQAAIFRPFNDDGGPFRGSGLGLFISKSFVEILGGRIDVESDGEHGTAFSVRLPAGDLSP